ncbi:MAG: LPXTG cell wall anchor domain-containing protein [Lachnospiraceae bacterium]|nr:LPXTG cell wall anchor domain-containing protein [Lachnospiraceae bacterium]
MQEISITDKKMPKPHVPQTGGNTPFTAVSFLLLLVGSGVYLFRKKKVRV